MSGSRRTFLQAAGLTALSQRRILGANDRIRLGGIGIGGRGTYVLTLASQAENTQVVALSDVYTPRMAEVKQKLAPDAAAHQDYRELLARNDLDAVVIGSPDHWHVPMTIDAVQAGKDVYCEKPISHSIEDGERLLKAVQGTKQVIQVGYQQRSWEHYQLARELVASGKLGTISLALTSWYQNYRLLLNRRKPTEVDKLDWQAFLGSAPKQPFDPLRASFWRFFWDFGGGHLTDLFSHWIDVVHWHTGHDSPRSVQVLATRLAFPEFECPDTINAAYEYPAGLTVVHNGSLSGSLEAGNIVYHGSQGLLRLNRSGFGYWQEGMAAFEKPVLPEPVLSMQSQGDGTIAHVQNFLDCVRTRKTPNSTVDSAVKSARSAHLGNLAYRKGTRITG